MNRENWYLVKVYMLGVALPAILLGVIAKNFWVFLAWLAYGTIRVCF